MMPPMHLSADVPLAPLTTFKLGGCARWLAEATNDSEVVDALHEAERLKAPVLVLGGGSNVVIPDEGWPGVVVRMAMRGIKTERASGRVRVKAAAGEGWEELVRTVVAEGWSGLECLAGIPGSVGATPIQNVGAYGYETGDALVGVRAWDRREQVWVTMTREACSLSYRNSIFKQQPNRWIVVEIEIELAERANSIAIRYAELARALGIGEGESAPVRRVAETVVELRRGKGMIADPNDPESVSAGSYFTNPVLGASGWEALQKAVRDALGSEVQIPSWPTDTGGRKVAAAWLIERAGFRKGYSRGAVGISNKHALALVNRGGSTGELLALEGEIVQRVRERFGVVLAREPVLTLPH
jgi:UDP-N-acetylmuramate dehydrogenase